MDEHTAEKDAAQYVFTFDVIASDPTGYYIDRWDRASRYEVIGATKAKALEALWALVGQAQRGRQWRARQVGTVRDTRILPPGSTEAQS